MKVQSEEPANGPKHETIGEAMMRLANQLGSVHCAACVAERFEDPGTGRVDGAAENRDRIHGRMPTCARRSSWRNVRSARQGYGILRQIKPHLTRAHSKASHKPLLGVGLKFSIELWPHLAMVDKDARITRCEDFLILQKQSQRVSSE